VALVGPRQSGKTTIARSLVEARSPNYFDLEDPRSLARLAEPMTALASLRGVVVIDEIQRRPDLFPVLRVLADRRPLPARFLVLGSAGPDLLRQSSESLAGRLETIVIGGFSPDEAGGQRLPALWRRGGFPRSLLAPSETASVAWRQQFLQTYVERDIPQLGVSIPAPTLLRFWTMVAHYHGGVWNGAEAARSMAVSEPTARRYLDLLSGLFLIRQLQPWHENLKKRQVKAPKVYVRDSGVLHSLLGIETERSLLSHPKVGASWEGAAIEWALDVLQPQAAHFWATHQGAELDLLVVRGGRRYGIEVKRQDAPTLTPSMRIALADLQLDHLTVLYPGDEPYTLAPKVSVVPTSALVSRDVAALLGRSRRPASDRG
jgi:predicted AAA+ superfamily ATPase